MADQDGRHSEMITQLLHHMSSSPHDADFKGDIFRRTIYPPSLVVIAVFYSRSCGGGGGGAESTPPPPPAVEDGKKPGLNRLNLSRLVWHHLISFLGPPQNREKHAIMLICQLLSS